MNVQLTPAKTDGVFISNLINTNKLQWILKGAHIHLPNIVSPRLSCCVVLGRQVCCLGQADENS